MVWCETFDNILDKYMYMIYIREMYMKKDTAPAVEEKWFDSFV